MPPKKQKLQAKKHKEPKIKIRKDPLKEYAETMKAQGIATVSKLSNDEAVPNVTGRISTQSLALDSILRNPMEPPEWAGIPLSRVTELFGPPFIGKSTLLDHLFAAVQKIGGVAILADTEISRDRHYVKRLGVNLETLQYLEFGKDQMVMENVIQALYKSIDFWKTNYPDTPVVIGWDALGGTSTKDEWEKGMESGEKATQPGLAARVMHKASRQLPPRLAGSKVAIVILNHEYEMINSGFGGGFGKKRETYGGSGVRHAGTIRIQLYNGSNNLKDKDGVVVGREVVAKLVKNRLGMPLAEARIPIVSGVGVDNVFTVFEDLKKSGVIVTSGAWSAINLDGEVMKFQGWGGLKEKIAGDVTLFPRLVSVWKQANWKVPNYADLHDAMPEVPEDNGSDTEIRGEGQEPDVLPEVQN